MILCAFVAKFVKLLQVTRLIKGQELCASAYKGLAQYCLCMLVCVHVPLSWRTHTVRMCIYVCLNLRGSDVHAPACPSMLAVFMCSDSVE